MQIRLADDEQRRVFEREAVSLIGKSHLLRGEYLVREAIGQAGSDLLRAAAELPQDDLRIEGWDQLGADLLEADARLQARTGHRVTLATLSLVNRAILSGGFVERLEIERKFHVAFERGADDRIVPDQDAGYDAPDLDTKAPVFLSGLEALMAVQRRPWPLGAEAREPGQLQIDALLSGLLLAIQFHRLIDRYLVTPGLPMSLSLLVEMDQVSWSMQEGVGALGPQVRRFVPAVPPVAENAAAEIRAEDRARHQTRIGNSLAELRELYRLVRMFPFYRRSARNKLGDLLTSRLKLACLTHGISEPGVSWRMPEPEFERLLRRLAEARKVDADDALDTRHIDALHDRWLEVARRMDFRLGSAPLSLFELGLAVALARGGPILHDRWERAKPYRTS